MTLKTNNRQYFHDNVILIIVALKRFEFSEYLNNSTSKIFPFVGQKQKYLCVILTLTNTAGVTLSIIILVFSYFYNILDINKAK